MLQFVSCEHIHEVEWRGLHPRMNCREFLRKLFTFQRGFSNYFTVHSSNILTIKDVLGFIIGSSNNHLACPLPLCRLQMLNCILFYRDIEIPSLGFSPAQRVLLWVLLLKWFYKVPLSFAPFLTVHLFSFNILNKDLWSFLLIFF